ncbi:hypothetical protein IO99_13240 [Clostridium sulfidigenes]|uniref:HTH HARE-type domain-containing protein n=1 Tax=Clostridium sulfidigenes TaxID=318464 RepID=A0A084J9K1_9CLOT|nr:hypothetical protein [Clostridium sulfidigenes]KEZ85635.1 hypothetical protein IO99_13240 [Clostridium sulfidigenes]
MKTQEEIIQEVLKNNNGYAYFSQIYNDVFTIPGNSFKKENKYKESIRGYVQRSDSFFSIKPGLWALEEYRDKLPEEIKEMIQEDTESYFERPTTHSKIQADLIAMGKELGYITYIPSQDKTKVFEEGKKLIDIVDIYTIPIFTYKPMVDKVRTIDIIWFKDESIDSTKMFFPKGVFEIETSTNFVNSLEKFKLLINFNMQYFYIISPKEKEKTFNNLIVRDEFEQIRNRVKFLAFEDVESLVSNPNILKRFDIL